jgi:hypothetical protein
MKTTKYTSLLGVGILSAGLMGIAAPVLADDDDRREGRREVKQERKEAKKARKEVKEARKEVRKADTREERREAREDLREARKEYREERRDVRQERRENRRENRNDNWRYNNGRYNNRNNGNYNNGRYNNYNRFRTLEGVVTNDLSGNGFIMRTGNGYNVRVVVQGGEPNRLDERDRVRVYGTMNGNVFVARNLSILRDR